MSEKKPVRVSEEPSVTSGCSPWAGAESKRAKELTWRGFLWRLVYPLRSQQVRPTVAGVILVVMSMAIGLAAYNSASNILFIALALLLACLILSGILSWWNFKKMEWRVRIGKTLRVGQAHTVSVEFRNGKRVLPTYALKFELRSENAAVGGKLAQTGRLDAGEEGLVEWGVTPVRRGRERIELVTVGSLFPFGFLQKSFHSGLSCGAVVWPALISYRRFSEVLGMRASAGGARARGGEGADLVGVRDYHYGDAQRVVHWKASARLQRLVVRQTVAEVSERFVLKVETGAGRWAGGEPEQFELMCCLAATLAEELFKQNRLGWVVCEGAGAWPVRGLGDVEALLDWLALAEPSVDVRGCEVGRGMVGSRVLTFAPEGARGVIAYVDGEKAAAA